MYRPSSLDEPFLAWNNSSSQRQIGPDTHSGPSHRVLTASTLVLIPPRTEAAIPPPAGSHSPVFQLHSMAIFIANLSHSSDRARWWYLSTFSIASIRNQNGVRASGLRNSTVLPISADPSGSFPSLNLVMILIYSADSRIHTLSVQILAVHTRRVLALAHYAELHRPSMVNTRSIFFNNCWYTFRRWATYAWTIMVIYHFMGALNFKLDIDWNPPRNHWRNQQIRRTLKDSRIRANFRPT